ncbi:MAG: hypothetical protein AVDCRST_MAG05-4345, partial [uncultured Rubrobacteraceae bacterium]
DADGREGALGGAREDRGLRRRRARGRGGPRGRGPDLRAPGLPAPGRVLRPDARHAEHVRRRARRGTRGRHQLRPQAGLRLGLYAQRRGPPHLLGPFVPRRLRLLFGAAPGAGARGLRRRDL